MSRSADLSAPRDMTPWHEPHRSLNPEFSALSEPSRTGAAVSLEDAALLEVLLPVYAKLEDREEVCRSLGVSIQTGKGGTSGLSRRVCMRLTDPSDPFFLFELELLEDDYGVFKQQLELLVDFSGFPKYLVTMLENVCKKVVPYVVSFVVDSRDVARGTLRVLERTEFRTVEHISLTLLRQGDSGQKRYLAERFRHFERAYTTAVEEHRREAAEATANIGALKREVASLQDDCARLREALEATVGECKRNQLTSIGQLREEHASYVSQLRATLEADLRHTTKSAEECQRRLREELQAKDTELSEARKRIAILDSDITKMRSELRVSEDNCAAQARELEELRSTNSDLRAFRSQATSSMSESELHCVQLQERLRGLEHILESREKEHKSLRDQYKKQDNYVRILASQNEQLAEQKAKEEASLSKAHHIISTQLKNIKALRAKGRLMRSQIQSQDGLLREKESTITRLRGELTSSAEKLQDLQGKTAELREQLEKTDDARGKLANELRCANDALISLQRGASVSGRRWCSSLPLAFNGSSTDIRSTDAIPGLSGNYVPPTFGVYKELNRNASSPYRQFTSTLPQGACEGTGAPPQTHSLKGFVNHGDEYRSDEKLRGVGNSSELKQPGKNLSSSRANGVSSNSALVAGGAISAVVSEQNQLGDKRSNGQCSRVPMEFNAFTGALNGATQQFGAKSFFSEDTPTVGTNGTSAVRSEHSIPTEGARSAYF